MPLPPPDVTGKGRVTLCSEKSRINWETHTGCVYFINRILHPKTFDLAMTSSRLLPNSDWNSGLVQFSHSGLICRSHCMFYHLNFSGLLRQHRGEGIEKISLCILNVLGLQTVGVPLCKQYYQLVVSEVA